MRVFVTGATGFIGSAIVPKLLAAGHQVVGLARSSGSVEALRAAGAEVHRGNLDDLDSLRRGAAGADGVIHAAFDHDFSRFAENAEADRRAIMAIGDELKGSERPFVVTAGLPLVPGRAATEEDDALSVPGGNPRTSEQAAITLANAGVHTCLVRMSQAHDRNRQGLARYMIGVAREKGLSAYIGDGRNRWAAVHRLDAAVLYRLALEAKGAGVRYHAVSEENVPFREIAEAIGQGLDVPVVSLTAEQATDHFGWLGRAVGMDAPASSTLTQARLNWQPTFDPGFIENLQNSTAFDE